MSINFPDCEPCCGQDSIGGGQFSFVIGPIRPPLLAHSGCFSSNASHVILATLDINGTLTNSETSLIHVCVYIGCLNRKLCRMVCAVQSPRQLPTHRYRLNKWTSNQPFNDLEPFEASVLGRFLSGIRQTHTFLLRVQQDIYSLEKS